MAIIGPLPYTLQNNTTNDANQVMADLNQVVANVNANGAENGANSSITSLSGLTTPLSIAQGGTGANTAAGALTNLGVTNFSMPSGALVAFAGSAAPTGWLFCDGSAVSRTTYAALFTAIGTAYGVGDGSSTFNVPDMRGRVPAGFDSANGTGRLTGQTGGISAATLGNSGGEQTHTLSTAELAAHSHGVTDAGHVHSLPAQTMVFTGAADVFQHSGANNMTLGGNTGSSSSNITIQNAGSGSAHNNVQPGLVVNYIIKT